MLNIPCRGQLVLLYNKCPLSLFRWALLLILHIMTFQGASKQMSPTNSLGSPVLAQVNTDSQHQTKKKRREREREKKNVGACAHFVLSPSPLKKVVFGDGFPPLSVLRAALSCGCWASNKSLHSLRKLHLKARQHQSAAVCCRAL